MHSPMFPGLHPYTPQFNPTEENYQLTRLQKTALIISGVWMGVLTVIIGVAIEEGYYGPAALLAFPTISGISTLGIVFKKYHASKQAQLRTPLISGAV